MSFAELERGMRELEERAESAEREAQAQRERADAEKAQRDRFQQIVFDVADALDPSALGRDLGKAARLLLRGLAQQRERADRAESAMLVQGLDHASEMAVARQRIATLTRERDEAYDELTANSSAWAKQNADAKEYITTLEAALRRVSDIATGLAAAGIAGHGSILNVAAAALAARPAPKLDGAE